MDFSAAIQAHSAWKLKLLAFANGNQTEKLDSVAASKDHACALGQWLYGEGKKLMSGKSEYGELVKLHADFHRAAGSFISMIEKGRAAEVKSALNDAGSPYNQTSLRITQVLMKLGRGG